MGVQVKNPTDKAIGIWWGHTPYIVNPNETIVLPDRVAKECLKHNDYKDLVIIENDGTETLNVTAPEPTPEVDKFWEDDSWDPLTAPEEELKAYADFKGIIWNEEDVQLMRDTIYETLMEE